MTSGIRISQAGIPVNRAADYQKTMDERWPTLEHSFMGIVDIQNFSTSSEGVLKNSGDTIVHIPIYKHSSGYLPSFRVKQISYSGFTTSDPLADDMFADENYIYLAIDKSPGDITINVKFWLAVVDRDCSKEFQASIEQTTSTFTTQPSQYGLKILNTPTAAGMNEKNKSAYTLNTNAKSLTIQQHGVRTADANSSFQLLIDHRLGYPPTYYIARQYVQEGIANPSVGKLTIAAIGTDVGLGSSNSITLTIRGGQAILAGDYVFIILKDPVDVAR